MSFEKGNYMRRTIKCNTNHLCIAVFTFCLLVRFDEYFLIETDKTAIGENVLHKVAAFLFGVWHIVMPLRSYVNGEMSFAAMALMSIGYIILAGIMGIKWGLLTRMTGNLWVGLGDHLFNNTVATNMLHVVSSTGADELQIVRIMAAQLISFAFVLVIYIQEQKKPCSNKGDRRKMIVLITEASHSGKTVLA